MDGLKFSALICCCISIGLLVIVLISSDWVETTKHAGLWKICNGTKCDSFGMQLQGYIHGTRALLIIGLIIGTVSLIDLCASFGHAYLTASSWTKFTSKAGFFAGLSVLFGLCTFTVGYFVSGAVVVTSLGWTYGLGWIPGPLFFVTGLSVARFLAMAGGLLLFFAMACHSLEGWQKNSQIPLSASGATHHFWVQPRTDNWLVYRIHSRVPT